MRRVRDESAAHFERTAEPRQEVIERGHQRAHLARKIVGWQRLQRGSRALLDGVSHIVQGPQSAADDEPDHDAQHGDEEEDRQHDARGGACGKGVAHGLGLRHLDGVVPQLDVECTPLRAGCRHGRVSLRGTRRQHRKGVRCIDKVAGAIPDLDHQVILFVDDRRRNRIAERIIPERQGDLLELVVEEFAEFFLDREIDAERGYQADEHQHRKQRHQ